MSRKKLCSDGDVDEVERMRTGQYLSLVGYMLNEVTKAHVSTVYVAGGGNRFQLSIYRVNPLRKASKQQIASWLRCAPPDGCSTLITIRSSFTQWPN
jgi:hypothetical protein